MKPRIRKSGYGWICSGPSGQFMTFAISEAYGETAEHSYIEWLSFTRSISPEEARVVMHLQRAPYELHGKP